jgi:hypothetical protein
MTKSQPQDIDATSFNFVGAARCRARRGTNLRLENRPGSHETPNTNRPVTQYLRTSGWQPLYHFWSEGVAAFALPARSAIRSVLRAVAAMSNVLYYHYYYTTGSVVPGAKTSRGLLGFPIFICKVRSRPPVRAVLGNAMRRLNGLAQITHPKRLR